MEEWVILEGAMLLLDLSKRYGFVNTKLLEQKRELFQDIIDNPSWDYYPSMLRNNMGTIIFVLVLILLFLLIDNKNEITLLLKQCILDMRVKNLIQIKKSLIKK
jgi:hypothetical protein